MIMIIQIAQIFKKGMKLIIDNSCSFRCRFGDKKTAAWLVTNLMKAKQFLGSGIRKTFSDILEQNNDYCDTLDLRRGWVGEVMFFVLQVPDYKSIMLIYLYILYIKIRCFSVCYCCWGIECHIVYRFRKIWYALT